VTPPLVIDNQQHRLADELDALLPRSAAKSLDIATAYFATTGYPFAKNVRPGPCDIRYTSWRRSIGAPPTSLRVRRRAGRSVLMRAKIQVSHT